MDQFVFKAMLSQMDAVEMARHSTINHHANGVNYICLHRTPKLTAKLYYMADPVNVNGEFLINPHSHLYPFMTTVLHGELVHILFSPAHGTIWDGYKYCPKTKRRDFADTIDLLPLARHYERGEQYFVQTREIHTLQMLPDRGPLLLGLLQFGNERDSSLLFLPHNTTTVNYSDSRQPSVDELNHLRDRIMPLI